MELLAAVLLLLSLARATSAQHEGMKMGRKPTMTTSRTATKPKEFKMKKNTKKRKFRTHSTPNTILNHDEKHQQPLSPTPVRPNDNPKQPKNKEKQQPLHLKGIPRQEKDRQLLKREAIDSSGKMEAKFSGQGVGRGVARAAKGSAEETSDNGGFGVPRDGVPMVDWSNWGTIWVSNGRDSFQEQMGGRGEGNFGDGEDEETPPPEGESLESIGEGNEDWRKQFVSGLTPAPSPLATPPPTPSPTTKPPTSAGTIEPTPIPTTPYDSATRGACQLCSDGGAAAMEARTLLASSITCQDIANGLAMADADDCPMQKSNIPVALEAYCGCPGVSYTPTCTFCKSGTENIWHNITIPALQDWTCEQVETYTSFINNAAHCSEMSVVSDLCCGTWEEYWAEGDDTV